MRPYDEAYAAAKDRRPFSNGTEGFAWMGNWCDQCVHDKGTRDGSDETGCPLVMVALMQRTPVEWLDQTENGHRLGDTYHCTEFVDEDDGPDDPEPEPEPEPPPVIEGQVDMFEVFADQIVEQVESAVSV
jgi:hypothetical protein